MCGTKEGSGFPHVCTQAAFDLFGQVKDVRHFWIPDILWILQPLFYKWDRLNSTPIAQCIAGHIQTECSLSSEDSPVCCACEGWHMCVHSGMWFLFFTPPSVAFLWGISPESFSYCHEKSNMSCFLECSHDLLWNMPSVWQKEWTWLCDIIAVFAQRELCHFDQTLYLCKLQKHKHMPKEFKGNNLASWFKLEASCMKRGRPHTTFPWSLQGIYPGTPSDAIPLNLGCLGQLAVEECCILFNASEISIMQFSAVFLFLSFFFKWMKDLRESSSCSLNLEIGSILFVA